MKSDFCRLMQSCKCFNHMKGNIDNLVLPVDHAAICSEQSPVIPGARYQCAAILIPCILNRGAALHMRI